MRENGVGVHHRSTIVDERGKFGGLLTTSFNLRHINKGEEGREGVGEGGRGEGREKVGEGGRGEREGREGGRKERREEGGREGCREVGRGKGRERGWRVIYMGRTNNTTKINSGAFVL